MSHEVLKIIPVCKVTVSPGIRKNLFNGMWSKSFKWWIPNLRSRAEITKQLVSSVKKFKLLLVMVLEKKLEKKPKCLAKQFPSPQPAGTKGKLVEQSGCRELQSGPWYLQAAKLLCFPSCCPSPCSLPTYTHSCSLPGRPWCPPMSKNLRNAAPQCCGQCCASHWNTCCLQNTALNIPWCHGEQKCEAIKATKGDFLPFLWTAGKAGGYF